MKTVKLHIKKTLSLVMAFTITLSSIGIHFYYHQCTTTGQLDVVLTTISNESFNIAEEVNCCCLPEKETVSNQCEHCKVEPVHIESTDCCKTGNQILKIENEYLTSLSIHPSFELLAIDFYASNENFSLEHTKKENTVLYNVESPPKLFFGKLLLTVIHQLKIAPSHIA